MKYRYPLSSPNQVSPEAVDAAIASLRSGQFTMGERVRQFEHDIERLIGVKHAIMVNSGSSANLLAVEALMRPSRGPARWVPGDEIIVPALCWSTSIWPLIQLGLRPVFVDIDPATLAINTDLLARAVTPRTRGVMLLHILGCPAKCTRTVARFCRDYGFDLIEDACESFGARLGWPNPKWVGTFGTIGTFSHFFSHQLSTIEGGTLVTDSDEIADDLRSMRAHGWSRNRRDREDWNEGRNGNFNFVTSGYCVRPLDLCGAIGCVELAKWSENLARRQQTAATLRTLDLGGPWRTFPDIEAPVATMTWMNFPIWATEVSVEQGHVWRETVVAAMEQAGVETRPIIAGNFLDHPVMRRTVGYGRLVPEKDFPVAHAIDQTGFMIGCHAGDLSPLETVSQVLSCTTTPS